MPQTKPTVARDVYIVDGRRTPFLKARAKRGPFSASHMAVRAGQALLAHCDVKPTELGEVVMGCVSPSENEANIARIVALRLGCGDSVPGYSVQRNCGSGLQAVDSAVKDIASGRHSLVLTGGTEAMSHAPLLLRPDMVNWIGAWMRAKSVGQRLALFARLRPHYFKPIVALLCGLTDPIVGLNMGQTAENLAYDFKISREAMDAFALESHRRAAKAQDNHYFSDEIVPLFDDKGNVYSADDGVRCDTDMDKLGTLSPLFDKKFGLVTAGNSSQVTDGCAVLLLASKEALKKYHLNPLARIIDMQWSALSPSHMGLGPTQAVATLLARRALSLEDIDYWEINEAFACQVLACLEAWNDKHYCVEQLGLKKPLGVLDRAKLNIDGGAVALGHPVGASGARILLHLAKVMQRKKAKRGMAAICIGGGQGGALLIERVS